jgi:hypothetical protein
MKTKINVLVLLVAVIMTSCSNDKYGMITVINRDGSCNRELTFHLDSAQLVSGKIDFRQVSVQLNRKWKMSWVVEGKKIHHSFPMTRQQYDSIKNSLHYSNKRVRDVVTVVASSSWDNVEVMGQNTKFALKGFHITPKAELSRSFKWFYTDYTYRETFPKQKIDFRLPLEKYLSKQEIGYWYAGQPNLGKGMSGCEIDNLIDGIKDKYSKWLDDNLFEMSYETVLKNYLSVIQAPVSKSEFVALHDSLSHFFAKKNQKIIDEGQTAQFYQEYFHSNAYSSVLKNEQKMGKSQIELEKFEGLVTLNIDYQLVMPGKVIDDGGGIVGKNTISYRLSGERLIPNDYTIMARSRATNVWAFVLTGILILLTIIILFVKPHRTLFLK